jgi:hypothetical protein
MKTFISTIGLVGVIGIVSSTVIRPGSSGDSVGMRADGYVSHWMVSLLGEEGGVCGCGDGVEDMVDDLTFGSVQ